MIGRRGAVQHRVEGECTDFLACLSAQAVASSYQKYKRRPDLKSAQERAIEHKETIWYYLGLYGKGILNFLVGLEIRKDFSFQHHA